MNADGKTEDLIIIGTTLYLATVKTVLLQTILDSYSFSLLYFGFILATLKLMYAYMIFISYVPFPTDSLVGIIGILFTSAPALFNIFLTPFVNFLLSYLYKLIMTLYYPTAIQKMRINELAGASLISPYR
jgi:hypothetical protein